MQGDRERTGDWTREEWAGDAETTPADRVRPTTDDTTTQADATTATGAAPDAVGDDQGRWVKTEWVGDQGQGMPQPVDPDLMDEGDTSISGGRHVAGEQHWAGEESVKRAGDTGDRPLDLP